MTNAFKQLTPILRDGETVDGSLVHWEDDNVLDNVVEALNALDANALQALAREVGIDVHEADVAAERLCALLRAEQDQTSGTDPIACTDTTAGIKCTFVGNRLRAPHICDSVLVATADEEYINDANVGVSSSAGIYAFRGVKGAAIPAVRCVDVPLPMRDVFYVNSTENATAHTCVYNTTTASTCVLNIDVPSASEFSLANHVFGAVWQHLHDVNKKLSDMINDDNHHEQPLFIVLDGMSEELNDLKVEHVPARLGCQYTLSELDQLIAVSCARNGSRSNRRDRD